MLKVIIVEDNVLTVELIADILKSCCNEVEIVGTANEIETALKIIPEKSPDLVFFDINLPGGTSFDIIQRLKKIDFKIIFITSYDKYAIRAIKLSALDYLLKPVQANELVSAVKRAKELIKVENEEIQIDTLKNNILNKKEDSEKIVLKTLESIFIVNISDIVRCESGGSYSFFYLKNGKKITVSKLLKEYDDLLQNQGFIRVHQSHLININYVERFDKKQGGTLIMKDGAGVPVSYRKKDALFEIFDNFKLNL